MRLLHTGMWLSCSLLLWSSGVSAQSIGDADPLTSRPDFAWIEIAGGAGGGHALQGYGGWTAGPEPFLFVAAPFLRGRADLRFSLQSWTSDRTDLPSFKAVFGSIGWAPVVRTNSRLTILPGLRAGNFLMSFRTDQLTGQRVESEFAIEPFIRLDVRVTKHMALGLEGAARRIFTSPRLDGASLRAGMSWRLAAPDGLRDFLR